MNAILPVKLSKLISSVKNKQLDKDFINLTKDIRDFLKEIKDKFDKFDKINLDLQKQINFIQVNKGRIFNKLNSHFNQIWEIVKNFDRQTYKLHQIYYQQMLYDLLGQDIEINRHIFQKPLGYSGDFLTMNYIYDYCKGEYLGNSSYQRLINNYTCNIPFARSNIVRKDFLKEKILEIVRKKVKARILSVGCGSVRELIELLNEGEIRKSIIFNCLDFEHKALEYVKNTIRQISESNKKFINIKYIRKNMLDIMVNKKIKNEIKSQDLIYVAGVCDYLNNGPCSALVKQLYQLLNTNGVLIICNASRKAVSHRAYYELLGEWKMCYKTKSDMLEWTKKLNNLKEVKFEKPKGGESYLILNIKKA